MDWSPEQISGWLKLQYRNDESKRVSHETIYRSLFIQARGALKQELVKASTLAAAHPASLAARQAFYGHSQGKIVDAISIRERPAEVAKIVLSPVTGRAIYSAERPQQSRGHAGGTSFACFCMLIKVSGKDTATVVAALSQHVRQLPARRCAGQHDLGSPDWRWPNTKASPSLPI